MKQANLFSDSTTSLTHAPVWHPTRCAALERLHAFLPRAGSAYAQTRNNDLGPTDRSNVSCLSPYLAHRMITEEEVVKAVLQRHSFAAAEKFVQEVYWRTYWKGWLEMRPSVLLHFNQDRLALKARLADDDDLAARFERAATGQTGIDCFDAWVRELRELGWLHNHARMWFASIWIFTLKLPWQLGADFFYKHLLDADAASNTLSWRWVGGLHTKGKHYVARASNIAGHSDGRFNPRGQLNEYAQALPQDFPIPGPMSILPAQTPRTDKVGLLLTEDDLHPASWDIGAKPVAGATFALPVVGEGDSPKARFSQGALEDARARLTADFGLEARALDSLESLVVWAKSLGVTEIVTGYAPTGLIAWKLQDATRALKDEGIDLIQLRRGWDTRTWPLATGGFFKLKEKLPSLIQAL
jgi:deoxyribodipyrimidine photo-lyase